MVHLGREPFARIAVAVLDTSAVHVVGLDVNLRLPARERKDLVLEWAGGGNHRETRCRIDSVQSVFAGGCIRRARMYDQTPAGGAVVDGDAAVLNADGRVRLAISQFAPAVAAYRGELEIIRTVAVVVLDQIRVVRDAFPRETEVEHAPFAAENLRAPGAHSSDRHVVQRPRHEASSFVDPVARCIRRGWIRLGVGQQGERTAANVGTVRPGDAELIIACLLVLIRGYECAIVVVGNRDVKLQIAAWRLLRSARPLVGGEYRGANEG